MSTPVKCKQVEPTKTTTKGSNKQTSSKPHHYEPTEEDWLEYAEWLKTSF